MRKIFRKFATVMLGLLTSVGIVSAINNTDGATSAKAADASKATLKLNSNYWGQADAYYTIYYWGGNTTPQWPGNNFNEGKAASGNVEITADYDLSSTHVIIVRWGDASHNTEWNRWSYFDQNTMTEQYNYFTNTEWTSCTSSLVLPTNSFTVNLYDGSVLKKTEEVVEGLTYSPSFYEKEGYRFDGWYTEPELINQFIKGTAISSNTNLYAKYVAAEDYTLLMSDIKSVFSPKVYAYMYRELDGGNNAAWPGEEIFKNALGNYEINIDVSKSYDKIIFSNGLDSTASGWAQTNNLDLKSTKDGDIYIIDGTKDSNNMYSSSISGFVTISIYDGTELKDTTQVLNGTEYYPTYLMKANHRLIGYYTDSAFETPFVKGTIVNNDISLYAKYVAAESTTVYLDTTAMDWDSNGDISVHYWSDNFAHSTEWPGIQEGLTKIEANYYSLTLNSEDSYDKFVITNGSSKTKNLVIDYTMNGTLVIGAPDTNTTDWEHDVDYIASKVSAHIIGDKIDMVVKHITTDNSETVEQTTATTNGVSVIRYVAGAYAFLDEASQDEKELALKTYFADVDTCKQYTNYENYVSLVNSVEGGRKLLITETVGYNSTLSIGEKIDFMGQLANTKGQSQSNLLSLNILNVNNKKASLQLIAIVSLIGLATITAYYFFNKKKMA